MTETKKGKMNDLANHLSDLGDVGDASTGSHSTDASDVTSDTTGNVSDNNERSSGRDANSDDSSDEADINSLFERIVKSRDSLEKPHRRGKRNFARARHRGPRSRTESDDTKTVHFNDVRNTRTQSENNARTTEKIENPGDDTAESRNDTRDVCQFCCKRIDFLNAMIKRVGMSLCESVDLPLHHDLMESIIEQCQNCWCNKKSDDGNDGDTGHGGDEGYTGNGSYYSSNYDGHGGYTGSNANIVPKVPSFSLNKSNGMKLKRI